MKKTVFAFAVAMALAAGPALASQCPMMMKDVDAALQTAQLSQSEREQVMELRERGEKLHSEGKHAESEEALGEAKKILGIN
jgi:hypothetical protein